MSSYTKACASQLPGIKVYGGKGDKAAGVTDEVGHGDKITIREAGLHFSVLATPCHTPGHVCYFIEQGDKRAVFTGKENIQRKVCRASRKLFVGINYFR